MPAVVAFDHPALAQLSEALQEAASTRLQLLELPPEQMLIGLGQPCPGLPLVLRGCVRVQILGAGGNQIVLYRIGPGDACTLSVGCLMGNRRFMAEALTEEPTRVALLPADLFEQLMRDSAAFRQYILASYGSRLQDLMQLVEKIAFQRMDQRLAACLLQQARGEVVEATHQELAIELGTAREGISRLLKRLERSGLVQLQRGRVTLLAPTRLRQMAAASG